MNFSTSAVLIPPPEFPPGLYPGSEPIALILPPEPEVFKPADPPNFALILSLAYSDYMK